MISNYTFSDDDDNNKVDYAFNYAVIPHNNDVMMFN
jgi:hypothetical protein